MGLSNIPVGTPSLERWQRDRDSEIVRLEARLDTSDTQLRNTQQRLAGGGGAPVDLGQTIWTIPPLSGWSVSNGNITSEKFANTTRVSIFTTLNVTSTITVTTSAYTTISGVFPPQLWSSKATGYYNVVLFGTASFAPAICYFSATGDILLRAIGSNVTMTVAAGLFSTFYSYLM